MKLETARIRTFILATLGLLPFSLIAVCLILICVAGASVDANAGTKWEPGELYRGIRVLVDENGTPVIKSINPCPGVGGGSSAQWFNTDRRQAIGFALQPGNVSQGTCPIIIHLKNIPVDAFDDICFDMDYRRFALGAGPDCKQGRFTTPGDFDIRPYISEVHLVNSDGTTRILPGTPSGPSKPNPFPKPVYSPGNQKNRLQPPCRASKRPCPSANMELVVQALNAVQSHQNARESAENGDVGGYLFQEGLAYGGLGYGLGAAGISTVSSMLLMGTGLALGAAGVGYSVGESIDEAGYNPFTPVFCTGAELIVDFLNDPSGVVQSGLEQPPALITY